MTTVKYWRQHRDNGQGVPFCPRRDGEIWGSWSDTDCRDCLRIGRDLGLYVRNPGWKRDWPRQPKTRRPR